VNWNANDMDTYMQQKEYIDTLLVPLLKLETNPEKMKSSSSSTEFLMYLSTFMENQFKGRIMLLPPFSYTQSMDLEILSETLQKDIHLMDFKHVFYLTTDANWTSIKLEDVIWLPSIPLESMDKQLKQKIIEDQLRQVLPLLTKKWSD
jgi:hypothetical protein